MQGAKHIIHNIGVAVLKENEVFISACSLVQCAHFRQKPAAYVFEPLMGSGVSSEEIIVKDTYVLKDAEIIY